MANYPKDLNNNSTYDVREFKTGSGSNIAGYPSKDTDQVKTVVPDHDKKTKQA
jgi:hypothetical protein